MADGKDAERNDWVPPADPGWQPPRNGRSPVRPAQKTGAARHPNGIKREIFQHPQAPTQVERVVVILG